MIAAPTARQRDRLLAVVGAAFAANLVVAARAIEDSLLADAVGAGGVPQAVGIAMLVASLALFAKTFVGGGDEPAAGARDGTQGDRDDPDGPRLSPPAVALRTAALVAILAGYAALLPLLGYPLAVSLLVAGAGWLAGAAPRWPLWACAAVTGPALWAMFDRALQVRMPVGSLWGG